jgi:phospholipase/carboxylesterase
VALAVTLGVQAGCGLLGPEPSASNDVLVSTQFLSAILKLPQGYDSTRTYPLLVALHGNGGTAGGLAPAFTPLAGDSILVLVPQGEHPGPSGGYSWFLLTSDRGLWVRFDTQSVEHVLALASAVGSRYRVGKLFVLGFSQGASLAYMIGLRNPARVSGVLAIGGLLPEIDQEGSIVHAHHIAEAQGLKIFLARGKDDPLVSHDSYESQREFFLSNGYAVSAYEYAGGHALTDDLMGQVRQWLATNSRE